jgi:hypothetical protein
MFESKFNLLYALIILSLASCTPVNPAQPTDTSSPVSLPAVSAAVDVAATAVKIPNALIFTPTAGLPDQPFITLTGGDIDYAIVRSGAGAAYPQVGLLKPGDKATALGQTGEADWFYIKFPSAPQGKAWINSAFVKLHGGDLPVVDSKTGLIATPAPTTALQVTHLKAVDLIQRYIKQDKLQYDYLGKGSNLNNINHPNQSVEVYQVGSTVFSIDPRRNQIVEIETQLPGHQAGGGKKLTQAELEQKARSLIADLAGEIKLQTLTPETGNKGNNYFFRWTESASLGFVQVGYSQDGQLLNFVNSIETP